MDPDVGTPPPADAAPAAPADSGASRPATLQDVAEAEATKQGVDPRLVHAVINTESSYNPNAHNKSGAHGLMQLMPATAARWKVNAADPVENIRGGVSELKSLLDQHKGDVVMALRRYNGGPNASDAATQPYVDKVLGQLKPSSPSSPGAAAEPVSGAPSAASPASATGAPGAPTPVPRGGGGRGQGPGAGGPPPAPAPPAVGTPPPESWGQWAIRHGKDLASSFDPRTAGGRQNLGGAAGAAGLTALAAASAPVSAPLAGLGLAAAGITGAFAGGEAANLGEQVVGNAPPSTESALTAGASQGAQEAVGHGMMWPVQAIGRRMIAGKVGRAAEAGISAAKTATLSKLQGALDTAQGAFRKAKTGAKAGVAQASDAGAQLVEAAQGRTEQGVKAATAQNLDEATVAKDLAEHGTQQATKQAEAGVAGAKAPYEAMVGSAPPSAAAAGRATNEVIQKGGAAEARNMAGRAVDEAAASGPDIATKDLKAEAEKVINSQIKPPERSFPRRSAEEVAGEAADSEHAQIAATTGMTKEEVAGMAARAAENPNGAAAKAWEIIKKQGSEYLANSPAAELSPAEAALASAQSEAGHDALKHPAMGILQRIMNAPETVPFRDAHLWKVELDNAIRNTRDQATKSQVQALTQKFAGSLRGSLKAAGHAPYEQATAAYAQIAPLYTKGYAASLKKVATEAPESIVSMLNPNQPTKAKMLVDLLTHQAEKGGDAEGGRAALEAVQASWVRKKVIEGGLDKLGDRLDKIPPEFRQAFLGDPKAKAVLDNLKLIHTAYKTAALTGEQGVEAAAASGKAGVSTARALAEERLGAARTAGAQDLRGARTMSRGMVSQARTAGATAVEQARGAVTPAQEALKAGKAGFEAQEQALRGSSLRNAMQPGAAEQAGADVLRASVLGPHSIWGGLSIMRLLKGPTAADLVQWASHSNAGTKAFVRAVTSPVPSTALADLVRSSGILSTEPTKKKAGTGAPSKPPAPAQTAAVGTPPPS